MARASKQAANRFRSRIVGEGWEAPDQLLANPANFRVHPGTQAAALAGALGDLGWVTRVVVNKRTGHVVDGHLRVALALQRSEATVPVTYVDLTEAEELKALATLDPIAAMAGTDKALLEELLATVQTEDAALAEFLEGLKPGGETGTGDGGGESLPPQPPGITLTQPGELIVLGIHRLLCGDSARPEHLAALLGDDQAGATVLATKMGRKRKPREETILALVEGVGAMLLACGELGRPCRILEPDPALCDGIIDHWETATGLHVERFPPGK